MKKALKKILDIGNRIWNVGSGCCIWLYIWLASWPLSVKTACLAVIWSSCLRILPSWVFQSHYNTIDGVVSPFGEYAEFEFFITGINTLIGVYPIFYLHFWFLRNAKQLENRLSLLVSDGFGGPAPTFSQKRHWIIAFVLASGLGTAVALAVLNDRITEWFEAVGWWAWSFRVLWILVPTLLVFASSSYIAAWFRWLDNQVKLGLKIEPLHPDGSGGLGFFGSTIGRLVIIYSMFGFWMFFNQVVLFYQNLQGLPPDGQTIGFVISPAVQISIYAWMIYFILIAPTRSFHSIMLKERNKDLEIISIRMRG